MKRDNREYSENWPLKSLRIQIRTMELVTKLPFDIGKPQLWPPRCDTRVTPEEKRRFLARRAQETKQRRALFNAETDNRRRRDLSLVPNLFMNSFHFREGWKYYTFFSLRTSFLRFWLARIACAYTSARSIGFCAIWVCISSSSSLWAALQKEIPHLIKNG